MFILIVIATIAGLVVGILSSSVFWGLWTEFTILGVLILEALVKIPAKPPHKALVTIRGKRQWKEIKDKNDVVVDRKSVYKDEGWRIFPLRPYWYDHIKVKVERITFTIETVVRTPDRANSKVPIVLTIRPDSEYLIEYIDSGEEEGAKTQLIGKIQERIREWSMSQEEGPMDWRELNRSQLEAVSVLIRAIAGKENLVEVPKYAQNVPTHIWMRYFSKPRPTKLYFMNEQDWMGEDGKWQRVEDEFPKIAKEQQRPVEDIKKELEEVVQKRREQITALRVGTGDIRIPDLGIKIERLNISDTEVLGEVAKKADTQAKKREEGEADNIELEYVRKRIQELISSPFYYSKEEAKEIVQTERGKVAKTINESKWNISPETRDMIENIGTKIITRHQEKRQV